MRVIAGTARSIPLIAPEGNETRPTTDRIKETLFNMLQFDLPGCIFLDFFAGSGAIGIEAISRGAKEAYFIDNGRKPADCIRKNLAKCKFEAQGHLMQMDAVSAVNRIGAVIDKATPLVVFMDPPYDKGLEFPVLAALLRTGLVTEHTIVVVETSLTADETAFSAYGYEVSRVKRYKNQKHVFLKKQ